MANCKECEYNNNGWCKKYKMQKPKAVIECDNSDKETDSMAYIMTGKMEMLFTIVRQIEASPSEDVSERFKSVVKTIHEIFERDTKIHGIALEYEVDKAMLGHLKDTISKW